MTARFRAGAFVCAVLIGLVTTPGRTRAAENVETLIQKQSQEFSDASASGDVSVLDRYLDENVAFMDESGNLSSKKDILASAGPPPAGATQRLVQSDFVVRVHGSVAVTSFTDSSTVQFHGQTLLAQFRSTEVWLEEKDGWRMISSQTIALQQDPPAVVLPPDVLAQYVGTYRAGPGYDVAIALDADGLTASVNGGKPYALKAELRDVFFVSGQPRVRRIFERDPAGTVIGFVSRREGRDFVLQRLP